MSDRVKPLAEPARPIAAGARIGHVHLKVADLERALDFYCGVLGFELMQRYGSRGGLHLGRRLPPPHRPQHLGEPGGQPPPPRRDRASTTSPSSTRPARRSPTRCGA